MKERGFFSAFLLQLLLFIPLPSAQAEGCSCAAQKSVDEAYRDSSVVFVGRVEHSEKSALRAGMLEVRLLLLTSYKGNEEAESRVRVIYTSDNETPNNKTQCGYHFVPGQDYLVYATGNPAFFKTDSCSRTNVIDTSRDDITRILDLAKKAQ